MGNRFLSASIVRPGGEPILTVTAKAPSALIAETGPIGRVSEAGWPSPTIWPALVEVCTVTVWPVTVTLTPSWLTVTLFCWITLVCDQAELALIANEAVTIALAAPFIYLIRS